MSDLGWIPPTDKINDKVTNLQKFFGVVSLSLIKSEKITRIAYRKLSFSEKSDFALLAWAQKARIEARKISTKPIPIKKLKSSFSKLCEMTTQEPKALTSPMKEILAECGIAFLFLPHLTCSPLDSVTCMDGKKIVIVLSDRDWEGDKLRLRLFHEFAHIVLGHLDKFPLTDAEEKEADKWAEDILTKKDYLNALKAKHQMA